MGTIPRHRLRQSRDSRDPTHNPSEPGRGRGERGAVTAEVAIAVPVLLALIAAVVQFALWYHAAHSAEAVARHALATARAAETTQLAAQTHANQILDQLGGPTLTDPTVTVDRGPERTTVTVTATVTAVAPFLAIPIDTTVTGPTERFRPPTPNRASP